MKLIILQHTAETHAERAKFVIFDSWCGNYNLWATIVVPFHLLYFSHLNWALRLFFNWNRHWSNRSDS